MDEKICYLIIDTIAETQISSAPYRINNLLRRRNIQLTEDILNTIERWCSSYSYVGNVRDGIVLVYEGNGLVLDMLRLTFKEAQVDISYLAEAGISARVQYHNTEADTYNNTLTTIDIAPNYIVSDLNNLKQYLKDIYTLERELYCSEQAQQKILNTINALGKANTITIKEKKVGLSNFLSWGALIGVFGAFIGLIFISPYIESYIGGTIIGGIIGFICGIFRAMADKKSAKQNNQERNKALAEDRTRINKELSLVPIYQENEKLYAKNISSCKEALNQLYNANIIFPKYRNLIAVSQIYEYFMSGRCTELEGHEGAYNIFESELRQNIIIYQLNEALANLEEIKRTQFMIYEAIQESNQLLASIASNTSAIAYNTSVIATNTAICTRYV